MGKTSNRRQFFRIQVDREPCRLLIVSVGGKKVNINKEMLGAIMDISAGGLLFEGPLELPDISIEVKAFFRLEREPFALEATIMRKQAHEGVFRYGLRFDNLLEEDRERLLVALGRLQVKLRVKRQK